MSIAREIKSTNNNSIQNEFFAALKFCTPHSLYSLECQGKETLTLFQNFKAICLRYHRPIPAEILFQPLSKNYSNLHLFSLSTYDPDIFLHVVRYATRDAIDRTITAVREDGSRIENAGMDFLFNRYKKCKSLVFRPLFEKISSKTADDALQSPLCRSYFLAALMEKLDPNDALAFVKRTNPTIFQDIADKDQDLINVLIERARLDVAKIILPHISHETIFNELQGRYKPLEAGLDNHRISVFPAATKIDCCNEVAVYIIESLPTIPPINSMFLRDDFSNHPFNFKSHRLTKAIFNNPRLLNAIIRKAHSDDLADLKSAIFDIYSYLEPDVAMKIHTQFPDITYEKYMNKFAVTGDVGNYSRVIRPFLNYLETSKNISHVDAQRKLIVELFETLPQNMNRYLRSLVFEYAAQSEMESEAIKSELSAIYDLPEDKETHRMLTDMLTPEQTAESSSQLDIALLIMNYATKDQHRFYILASAIEKEKSYFAGWLPKFSFFSGRLAGVIPTTPNSLLHESARDHQSSRPYSKQ